MISVRTILLLFLVFALLGVIPTYPYSRGWGWGPSGFLGFILLLVLVLILVGGI